MDASVNCDFNFEPRHFVHGLTAKDFSAFAKAEIAVFDLSKHPHWHKLALGKNLSAIELLERSFSIKEALTKTFTDQMSFAALDNIALCKDFYVNRATGVLLKNDVLPRVNFNDVSKSGILEFPVKDRNYTGVKNLVFTEPLEYKDLPNADLPDAMSPVNSAVFLSPFQVLTDAHIKSSINFKDIEAEKYPKSPVYHLLCHVHEMRHLNQVYYDTPDTDLTSYYYEVDANLFARNLIRKNGLDDKTLEFDLHRSFLLVLCSESPAYNVLSVDAVECGEKPYSYTHASKAVQHIAEELFIPIGNTNNQISNISSPEIFSSNYQYHTAPQNLFRNLMSKYAAGSFRSKPLADNLALRILESVDYFAPHMLRAKINPQQASHAKAYTCG